LSPGSIAATRKLTNHGTSSRVGSQPDRFFRNQQEVTMNGSVYVFNVYGQSLTLNANGMQISAGSIPDWGSNAGTSRYRPNGVTVPRTLNASDGPGKFFNGRNSLVLQWLDGLYFASVGIDGGRIPLDQDLLLFFTRTSWQLVNQFGVQTMTGPVLPADELRDMLASATDS
jgi:hypothetical protein